MRTKLRFPGIISALLHCGAALTLILASIPAPSGQQNGTTESFGRIIRLDPRIEQIIPKDAVVERVADGFTWTEGPAWDQKHGYLLFSDIPENSILKWKEGEGTTLFLKPSGYTGNVPFQGKEPGSNGLTLD